MNYQRLTKGFMAAVLVAGGACVVYSLINVPVERADLLLVILSIFTIGVGSRITVQIPQIKSHIAVSDTFIFFALMVYGAEIAILLAAIEAFFSAWRFCSKKLTVFFNSATMALSTAFVAIALSAAGLYSQNRVEVNDENLRDFLTALSVIALTQFFVNTALACIHDSLKDGVPLLETWKRKYVWAFFSFFIGAVGAGMLLQLSVVLGLSILVATFPVIFFLFLTYRMYLRNVEMSVQQAHRAEEYAKALEQRTTELRESEQRFRSAFNYAPIGIALVSPMGNWLKVNRALTDILGYSQTEFLSTDFQSLIVPEDLGATLVKINELLTGKQPSCQLEQRYIHRNGHTVWTSWSVSAASEERSLNTNLIFQIQDITEKKAAEQRLQHEATHDGLTGLPNRALFMSRLGEALSAARETPGRQLSVLFIDLDRFKHVNDSLGHIAGDELLRAIAARMTECLRPADMVARLGGDEFTVLVDNYLDKSEVTAIAERIQRKFAQPFNAAGNEIYSSVSIGILHVSEKHDTSEAVMRDADTAMYQAKRGGKSRYEEFSEKMHIAARETLQLETDLRRAVESGELTVAYQPVHSLLTGEIEGLEALARWTHAELGPIPPAKFIPIAEEIGMISKLGELILRTACREIGSLRSWYEQLSDFRLSVNLSSKQFGDAAMVERIERIVTRSGFPLERLTLEITESVFLEYEERAVYLLQQLRALGIELHIDDFGTGYSNLSYLVRLPVSTLKIDRSFVRQINKTEADSEIVKTVISMARNLELTVVAEGVETKRQAEALRRLGCESAQGRYFGPELSFNELFDTLVSEASAESKVLPKAETIAAALASR